MAQRPVATRAGAAPRVAGRPTHGPRGGEGGARARPSPFPPEQAEQRTGGRPADTAGGGHATARQASEPQRRDARPTRDRRGPTATHGQARHGPQLAVHGRQRLRRRQPDDEGAPGRGGR
jgi:hypothetical protein